jgi:tRNA (guanine-N7-)-methyltransferase
MSRSRPAIDVSAHLIDPSQWEQPGPLNWATLFGNDRAVELEVGSGKGLFLQTAAQADPTRNYLGIELSRKYARLSAGRLARHAISNAKVWPGDVRIVLPRHVPAASVRVVHVYFPDPWWKKRHKKRRIFTETLVAEIERILVPAGQLRVASDVEEYFGTIQGLIAGSGRFRERDFPDEQDPFRQTADLTYFARKYRLEGRPISWAVFERGG